MPPPTLNSEEPVIRAAVASATASFAPARASSRGSVKEYPLPSISSRDQFLFLAALLLTQMQLVLLPDAIELLVGSVLEETQGIA